MRWRLVQNGRTVDDFDEWEKAAWAAVHRDIAGVTRRRMVLVYDEKKGEEVEKMVAQFCPGDWDGVRALHMLRGCQINLLRAEENP